VAHRPRGRAFWAAEAAAAIANGDGEEGPWLQLELKEAATLAAAAGQPEVLPRVQPAGARSGASSTPSGPVFQGGPKVAQGAVRLSRVRCGNPVILDGIT
jgi:hypothetical protein